MGREGIPDTDNVDVALIAAVHEVLMARGAAGLGRHYAKDFEELYKVLYQAVMQAHDKAGAAPGGKC